jgi:HEAT repeat protein
VGIVTAIACGTAFWITGAYTTLRVSQLMARLSSADSPTRLMAIDQLGEMGDDARPAVTPLIRLVNTDPDQQVRSSAAVALGKIGDEQAADSIQKWMSQLEAEGKKEGSHFKACQWALARLKKG